MEDGLKWEQMPILINWQRSLLQKQLSMGNPLQSSSTIGMNPNLKPEKTSSIEAGFEAAFWDNRLCLDFTYYKTDSRNQILKLATTAASGYTSQVRNAGHIRNRGYEIQLGAVPIQTSKGFRWNLDLNYGANSSKVVKLDDEGLITSYRLYSSGIQILASVGEAYGTLFGTSYVRDANGNVVVDANGLPKISTTNKTLGKFTPDWTGGISNTFSYRSLSLSFSDRCKCRWFYFFPTLIKLENIPVY